MCHLAWGLVNSESGYVLRNLWGRLQLSVFYGWVVGLAVGAYAWISPYGRQADAGELVFICS